MSRVAVAASSAIAAEAGAEIARQGGNAVDAAIAAAMVSMTTEPGVVSLAAGGFMTVWPADKKPVVLDGALQMPGKGADEERFGQGAWPVDLSYGGGISTVIGHGSVAVPGGLAMLEQGWRSYGRLPWKNLVEPACGHARDGFPLPQPSYNYLVHSGTSIFGWHEDSRRALFDGARLRTAGETIHVPHLADTLDCIAGEGAAAMYSGDIARLIVADVEANDGLLTAADLAEYEPLLREPLTRRLGNWTIATNPPPAVGGAALCALLMLMGDQPRNGWSAGDVARAAAAQRAVFGYRRDHLDLSDDVAADAETLLALCAQQPQALLSPSTIHVSAVDEDGLACSATLSSGYSAGVMPPGTGIWLNNGLGELELNRRGLVPGPPGTLLPSNMAPSVARSDDGAMLAIGSPGADRITTAIMMTMLNFVRLQMPLEDAIECPRLHVEFREDGPRIAIEPELDSGECDMPVRRYDELSMFFGGVGAALQAADGSLLAASDSRRTGGARVDG